MDSSTIQLHSHDIDIVSDADVSISPFVCQNEPSVCHSDNFKLPFICNYIPSVSLSRIQEGFTLIELIVTLTIAGILLAVAAPGMSGFVARNRLATQINDLIVDINLARSEAIKRGTSTGICVSTTGTSCTAGGNWVNGWLVYADEAPGVITVIKVHERLSGTNTLTAPADVLTYARSGILSSGTGIFTLCDSTLRKSRILNIGLAGRPSLTEGTCV